MLLRFEIANFRSFREPAELFFVATARRDGPVLSRRSRHVPHGVLPIVGVWGPNAAGKSNLLVALQRVAELVRLSFAHANPDGPVPWEPWGMTFEGKGPGRAELDLLDAHDVRYRFGFEVDAQGFAAEWLYRYETTRRQVLYERHRDASRPWYFGPKLGGSKRAIAAATRDNALFLSAAAQHNHPLLSEVWKLIVRGIRAEAPIRLHGYPLFKTDEPMLQTSFRPHLLRLLQAADLGVTGVRVEDVEDDLVRFAEADKVFHPDFLAALRKAARPKPKLQRVRLVHGPPGAQWEIPPEHESRGTNVLLARLSDLIRALSPPASTRPPGASARPGTNSVGATLLVDEFDTSLHPELVRELLRLFLDPQTNPHGTQLLFTTHDRSLLELEGLRSDEAVFVDKDPGGGTRLAAASDFKGIRARDNLRRAYEDGRLPGTPILRSLTDAWPTAGEPHGAL